MKKLFFLTIIFVILTHNLFGQAKEITRSETYQPFSEAREKLKGISYRLTSKEVSFKDGKPNSWTENIREFLLPNRYRFIETEKYGDKVRKNEIVLIDDIYYCRKDGGEWTKSQKGCGGGGFSGISDLVSSKFTVEETKLDGKSAKLFQQYTTYIFPIKTEKEELAYFQDKFWIDEKGFILQREMEYGSVEPSFVRSKQTDVYEYNPKDLKIEAPIK